MPARWGAGLAVGVFAAATLASAVALAVDEPENIVRYRQGIMRANAGHMGSLSAVAKGEVSFMDEAAGHAHAIHQMSLNLPRLWPEGTSVGEVDVETHALPAIWQQPDVFEQRITALQEESGRLVEVAEGGDPAAFAQQVAQLGRACGGCHEDFRQRQD